MHDVYYISADISDVCIYTCMMFIILVQYIHITIPFINAHIYVFNVMFFSGCNT